MRHIIGDGYHIAADLQVPENVTLVRLPPYSPELNPMENVWEAGGRGQRRGSSGVIRCSRSPTRQPNRACHAAAHMAEINKRVSPHALRHIFARHLLEQNIDIRVTQVLLGHANDTTAPNTRVATNTIREVVSPFWAHSSPLDNIGDGRQLTSVAIGISLHRTRTVDERETP